MSNDSVTTDIPQDDPIPLQSPDIPLGQPPWPNGLSISPDGRAYGLAANATGHAYLTHGIMDGILDYPFFVRVTPVRRNPSRREGFVRIDYNSFVAAGREMQRERAARVWQQILPRVGQMARGWWVNERDGVLSTTWGRVTNVGTMRFALVRAFVEGGDSGAGLSTSTGEVANDNTGNAQGEQEDSGHGLYSPATTVPPFDGEEEGDDDDDEDEDEDDYREPEVPVYIPSAFGATREDYFPDGDMEIYGRELSKGTKPSLGFR